MPATVSSPSAVADAIVGAHSSGRAGHARSAAITAAARAGSSIREAVEGDVTAVEEAAQVGVRPDARGRRSWRPG